MKRKSRTARTARPLKRKRAEHRRAPRVAAPLPVPVGLRRGRGVMRDVSASGIFFETDTAYAVGNAIEVELDLDTPWGKVMVRSAGRIVRIEPRDGRVGVAVRFADEDLGAAPARRASRRRV